MASNQGPVPAPGGQPSPEQIAQLRAIMEQEASRRGLTVEEFQAQQRKAIEEEAAKQGMSVPDFINKARAEAFAQQQRQFLQMRQQQAAAAQAQGGQAVAGGQQGAQQAGGGAPAAQQQQQQQQQVPIQAGPPNPQAVALAKWLKTQDLKERTCILDGQRRQLFRVKRALRAIQSEAYKKASNAKNSSLPTLTPDRPAEEIFKMLPLSLLALRVNKVDPHEGHGHAPPKKTKANKGLWTVKVVQQQEVAADLHYIWIFEGPQWKQKAYAAGALLCVFAVVLFPLWPVKLRIGVWYLSMGMLGLIGLFFVMAIFRLILFIITMFAVPPGLWLYPNLFEDVGFFDSFRPLWGWHEDPKAVKAAKKAKKAEKKIRQGDKTKGASGGAASPAASEQSVTPAPAPASADPVGSGSMSTGAEADAGSATRLVMAATVEEGVDTDSD